ncbi:MAG: iron-sulfur cluster repair di-iron protein [Ignavibacteriae bacterium]|nr:iron-sulfur cluster repair di-iron protein [Ignavibacteriota bacterium]NOG98584.1 iron-sulfur cluster repair di-iron protein [Ignavibacteriota bacterium]
MNELLKKTVAEIVTEDYRTAEIFKSYKIDFCCNGGRNFNDVLTAKNIDSDKIIAELDSVTKRNNNGSVDFDSWEIDLLADYIEKKHHRYVEAKTPELKQYLAKLCKVHGENHPELFEINEQFNQSAGELAMHMKKEELILFPHIRKMAAAKQKNEKVDSPQFGSVQNPIQLMMSEHDTEGERFKKIAEISNNYTVPDDGCNTYRVAFSLLKEFQDDLHLHIHLENNILFPKAIEYEQRLT